MAENLLCEKPKNISESSDQGQAVKGAGPGSKPKVGGSGPLGSRPGSIGFGPGAGLLLGTLRNLQLGHFFFWLIFHCLINGKDKNCTFGAKLFINSTAGPIQGALYKGVRVWSSIPYALPPTGSNRWQSPLEYPVNPQIIIDGSNFNPPYTICPQISTQSGANNIYKLDENCLFLSITAPIDYDNNPSNNTNANLGLNSNNINDNVPLLPVMVWIHGGGLVSGGGLLYDASTLVLESNNIIVVTINYRLGLFGFFSLNQLTNDLNSTNLGFQDQILALKWVQNHIASFGGDPNKITLFGSDAGGSSICNHLVSSQSSGLFQRAIIQSGECGSTSIWSPNQANIVANSILSNNNCILNNLPLSSKFNRDNALSCLYKLSFNDIINSIPSGNYGSSSFSFTLDNYFIKGNPVDIINKGKWNQVPVIIGINNDEMSSYLCPSFSPWSFSSSNEKSYLSLIFSDPNLIGSIINEYPSSSYDLVNPTSSSSYFKSTVDLLSDFYYRCPALNLLSAIANYNSQYYYSYNSFYFYNLRMIPGWSSACYGSQHAVELPFFFPQFISAFAYGYKMSINETILASNLRNVWINFAITGIATANNMALPQYCTAGTCSNSGSYLEIQSSTDYVVKQGFRLLPCHWWNENSFSVLNSTRLQPTLFIQPNQAEATHSSNLLYLLFPFFLSLFNIYFI